eukprot:5602270-Pleurochrysis_carterae.AAC.1
MVKGSSAWAAALGADGEMTRRSRSSSKQLATTARLRQWQGPCVHQQERSFPASCCRARWTSGGEDSR